MVLRGRRQAYSRSGQPQEGGRHTKRLQDRRLSKTVLEIHVCNGN